MPTFTMYQEDLRDVFNRMKNIVVKNDEGKPVFKGVHLIAAPDGLPAEAVDGYKLCTIANNLKTAPKTYCDFVIEPFTVPKAENTVFVGTAEVTVNEKTVDFNFPSSGATKTVRQFEGNFLDVAQALPEGNPDLQINLNPDYLLGAVKATKAYRKEKKPITLNIFGKDPLAVCAISCDARCCMVLPVRPKKPGDQGYFDPLRIIRISKDVDTAARKEAIK